MCIREMTLNWEQGGVRALRLMVILFLLSGFRAEGAGSSAYQLPYMEDFEVPLTNGMPVDAIGVWTSGPLDTTTVAATSYSFTETTRPIVPSADVQVLRLETGLGGTTNFFDVADTDQVVYLDSMLKLLPRSSIPVSATNDPSVQLFFFLNADTNLVVYHGGPDGSAPGMAVLPINPLASNVWNRFTVTLDYVHGDAGAVDRKYFKIQFNGADLTSAQAYSAPGQTGAYDGGPWFFTADQTGPDGFESVTFDGDGGLDDFVVTARVPSFSSTPVHYIASELAGAGSVSPSGEIPVVDGSSTQIVYQADAWHEISVFEQNGVSVPGAIGAQQYIAVLSNVQANVTNQVQFTESVATVDGKTPASWYGPLGADPALADEDGDGLTLYEEYLINTDPRIANSLLLFQYGMDALGWDDLDFPNGRVFPEVSTNLTEGAWSPLGGYLTREGGSTIWHFPANMPGEPFFLRIKVSE
jgi:hypothetical protein